MSTLTDEQKRRIEENRRKALEKLASRKLAKTQTFPVSSVKPLANITEAKSVGPSHVKTASSTNYQTFHCGKYTGQSHVNTSSNCFGQSVRKSQSGSSAGSAAKSTVTHPSERSQGILSFSKEISGFARSDKSRASNVVSGRGKPQGAECKQNVDGWERSVKGMCVLISKERFKVNVMFHAQLIALFKTIPSRSYDAKTTTWDFHLDDYHQLMKMTKPLAPTVKIDPLPKSVIMTFLAPRHGTVKELSSQDISLKNIDNKLVQALMPFQTKGVNFGIRNDGRVLIADDMGLGKTIQSICIACYYRAEWPLLVICPSSVRLTWKQAFCRWVPSLDQEDINVVWSGKDSLLYGKVTIVSYDLVPKKLEEIKKHQFRVVIADESHFVKNYKTARAKAVLPILKGATRVLLLSGTPALSRPMELYTQISSLDSKLFPSFHEFGLRYCAGTQNRFGWDYSGASNLPELQLLLEHRIMIRRLKSEVLTELPSKRRQVVSLDPSLIKTKSLEKAAKDVAKAKEAEKNGALLVYFNKTASAKLAAVREYLMDHLEGGHKFLVFAHHKAVLDVLCDCLYEKKIGHIRIDGSTPSEARQILCEKYQTKEACRVAVLSITAANTGLTLTAADSVIFAELFWNPGALVQAEDRVYRIGQKNAVVIHYLVAQGTADDYLWPLIQGKLEVLSKAGLSKDDFSSADSKTFLDSKQQTLFSYFETLIDESTDDDIMNIDLESVTSEGQNTETIEAATDYISEKPVQRKGTSNMRNNSSQSEREIHLSVSKNSKIDKKLGQLGPCASSSLWSEIKSTSKVQTVGCNTSQYKEHLPDSKQKSLSQELEQVSDGGELESPMFSGTEWFDLEDCNDLDDFEEENHNEPVRKKTRL